MYARVSSPASTPAIFSATYDSIVVERSGGPSHQFDHVPSSRRRARMSFASLRSVVRSRSPSTWSQNRCSATIVAFDSSSPTHQPSASWSSSSRATPASIVRSSVVSSEVTLMPAPPRAVASARGPRRCRCGRRPPSSRATRCPSRRLRGRRSGGPCPARGRTTPGRSASVASRLAAHARPEELSRAQPLDELPGDAVHELAPADLHRAPARHSTPRSNTDAPRPVRAP